MLKEIRTVCEFLDWAQRDITSNAIRDARDDGPLASVLSRSLAMNAAQLLAEHDRIKAWERGRTTPEAMVDQLTDDAIYDAVKAGGLRAEWLTSMPDADLITNCAILALQMCEYYADQPGMAGNQRLAVARRTALFLKAVSPRLFMTSEGQVRIKFDTIEQATNAGFVTTETEENTHNRFEIYVGTDTAHVWLETGAEQHG